MLGSTFFKLLPSSIKKSWVFEAYKGNWLAISTKLLIIAGAVNNIKDINRTIIKPYVIPSDKILFRFSLSSKKFIIGLNIYANINAITNGVSSDKSKLITLKKY
jgi:hypothetical protein